MNMELEEEGSSSQEGSQEVLCPPNSCPVCLSDLDDCQLGRPNSCSHLFCLNCIKEWSKNVNTCPVDRIPFNHILVLNSRSKTVARKIFVPSRRFEDVLGDPEGNTYCEICNECSRENLLLLCDGCDKGYHMFCLSPQLRRIPRGNWYCGNCQYIVYGQERSSTSASSYELHESSNDNTFNVSSDIEVVQNERGSSEDDSDVNCLSSSTTDGNNPGFMYSRKSQKYKLLSSTESNSEEDDNFIQRLSRKADHHLNISEESSSDHSKIVSHTSKRKRQLIDSSSSEDTDNPLIIIQNKSVSYISDSRSNSEEDKKFIQKLSQKADHHLNITEESSSDHSKIVLHTSKRKRQLIDSSSSEDTDNPLIIMENKSISSISDSESMSVLSISSTSSSSSPVSGEYDEPVSGEYDEPVSGEYDEPVSGEYDESESTNKLTQRKDTKHKQIKLGNVDIAPSTNKKAKLSKPKTCTKSKKLGITKTNKKRKSRDLSSIHSFHTPIKSWRARTAATPQRDASFREAVIASHRCERIADGLREAQKIMLKLRSPHNITVPRRIVYHDWYGASSSSNDSKPQSNIVSSMGSGLLLLRTPSLAKVTDKNQISKTKKDIHSSRLFPAALPKPKKLKLSNIVISSTTDYVGQIKENLDDLKTDQCVFNRDGSILPIRDSSVTPKNGSSSSLDLNTNTSSVLSGSGFLPSISLPMGTTSRQLRSSYQELTTTNTSTQHGSHSSRSSSSSMNVTDTRTKSKQPQCSSQVLNTTKTSAQHGSRSSRSSSSSINVTDTRTKSKQLQCSSQGLNTTKTSAQHGSRSSRSSSSSINVTDTRTKSKQPQCSSQGLNTTKTSAQHGSRSSRSSSSSINVTDTRTKSKQLQCSSQGLNTTKTSAQHGSRSSRSSSSSINVTDTRTKSKQPQCSSQGLNTTKTSAQHGSRSSRSSSSSINVTDTRTKSKQPQCSSQGLNTTKTSAQHGSRSSHSSSSSINVTDTRTRTTSKQPQCSAQTLSVKLRSCSSNSSLLSTNTASRQSWSTSSSSRGINTTDAASTYTLNRSHSLLSCSLSTNATDTCTTSRQHQSSNTTDAVHHGGRSLRSSSSLSKNVVDMTPKSNPLSASSTKASSVQHEGSSDMSSRQLRSDSQKLKDTKSTSHKTASNTVSLRSNTIKATSGTGSGESTSSFATNNTNPLSVVCSPKSKGIEKRNKKIREKLKASLEQKLALLSSRIFHDRSDNMYNTGNGNDPVTSLHQGNTNTNNNSSGNMLNRNGYFPESYDYEGIPQNKFVGSHYDNDFQPSQNEYFLCNEENRSLPDNDFDGQIFDNNFKQTQNYYYDQKEPFVIDQSQFYTLPNHCFESRQLNSTNSTNMILCNTENVAYSHHQKTCYKKNANRPNSRRRRKQSFRRRKFQTCFKYCSQVNSNMINTSSVGRGDNVCHNPSTHNYQEKEYSCNVVTSIMKRNADTDSSQLHYISTNLNPDHWPSPDPDHCSDGQSPHPDHCQSHCISTTLYSDHWAHQLDSPTDHCNDSQLSYSPPTDHCNAPYPTSPHPDHCSDSQLSYSPPTDHCNVLYPTSTHPDHCNDSQLSYSPPTDHCNAPYPTSPHPDHCSDSQLGYSHPADHCNVLYPTSTHPSNCNDSQLSYSPPTDHCNAPYPTSTHPDHCSDSQLSYSPPTDHCNVPYPTSTHPDHCSDSQLGYSHPADHCNALYSTSPHPDHSFPVRNQLHYSPLPDHLNVSYLPTSPHSDHYNNVLGKRNNNNINLINPLFDKIESVLRQSSAVLCKGKINHSSASCFDRNDSDNIMHTSIQVVDDATSLNYETPTTSTVGPVLPFKEPTCTSSELTSCCTDSNDQAEFIVPATGQSAVASSPISPLFQLHKPLPLFTPSDLSVSTKENSKFSPKTTPESLTVSDYDSSSNRLSLNPKKMTSLQALSFCLMNSKQAVAAVKRQLELHYIAGNITADALENIKERAIKKVQSAKKAVRLERIQKLVDEYVVLYTQK